MIMARRVEHGLEYGGRRLESACSAKKRYAVA
jgi:hypothetical protein